MQEFGRVLAVDRRPIGSALTADALTGATVLELDDNVEFAVGQGVRLCLADDYAAPVPAGTEPPTLGDLHVVTALLDQTGVQLAPALAHDYPADSLLLIAPVATETVALVQLNDGGDAEPCTVQHSLSDALRLGIREPAAAENVVTEIIDGTRYVTDILGRTLQRDLSSILPGSLDGVPDVGPVSPEELAEIEATVAEALETAAAAITEGQAAAAAAAEAGQAAQEAYAKARSAAGVYFSATRPTLDAESPSAIWFDTSNGYKAERWDGSMWTPYAYGSAAIAAGAIVAANIAAGAVVADKLAAGSVVTDKLAAGSVETDKLAAFAVSAAKIAAGAIVAEKLAAGAVSAEKIAAGAITAEKISALAITADKLAANAIDGKTISGVTVIGATIKTASSGKRIEVTSSDYGRMIFFNENNISSGSITTNGSSLVFGSGTGSLTVAGGAAYLTGGSTYVSLQDGQPVGVNALASSGQVSCSGLNTGGGGISTGGGNINAGSGSISASSFSGSFNGGLATGGAGVTTSGGGISTGNGNINAGSGSVTAASFSGVFNGRLATGGAGITTSGGGISTAGGNISVGGVTTSLTGGSTVNATLNSAGELGRSGSTRRIKDNIAPLDVDPEVVLALEPKTFHLKAEDGLPPFARVRYPGFIAEDAADLGLYEWVTHQTDGQIEGFRYAEFVAAQQVVLRSLAGRVAELEQQVADLRTASA